MRTRAIVIGIDQYTKPEWSLTGAVRDAVRFAHWALHEGGVAPEDLILLLGPLRDEPPLADPDLAALVALGKPATRTAIAKAWHAYQTGAGKDADRLFFYYAGHGLAPPGGATDAGPLIVPADVEDLDFYVNFEPLGLETFRGAMQNVAPKQQFFFIDACRDVLPITGNRILTQQLLWDLRGIDDDSLSTQAVFLSTTAGQKAKEIRGEGLFGRALIAALKGLGPKLLPPSAPPPPGQPPRLRLLFDQLVKFVIEAVKRGLNELPEADVNARKGIPYARVSRLTGEIPIAEFEPASIPTAIIGAVVDPEEARAIAGITFFRWDEETDAWVVRTANPAPLAPPLPEVASFKVRGGTHFLRVEAHGYATQDRELLIFEDKRFPIELEPLNVLLGASVPRGIARGGLESIRDGDMSFEADVVETGGIEVICRDRLARLAVYDGGGRELIRGYEAIRINDLVPGLYKVTAEMIASDRVEQSVVVRPGETQTVPLEVSSRLSPTVASVLSDNQISVTDGYAFPSEHFGPVANLSLASLLAYAAWGARWPQGMGFHHVRSLGVDPLPGLDPAGSALQVLVADAQGGAEAIAQCRVAVETSDVLHAEGEAAARTDVALTVLPTLPMAVQGSASLAPGTARVHVQVPAFAPASFAIALLPGFVTVLIIAREDDGDIDVRQHLNPIDPTVPVAPDFEPPRADDVRLVDLASRALESRDPLDSVEFGGLLEGKRSNPMLGVIAGYRMLGTSREDQFRGTAGKSPMANMLRLFDGLPDVHVLAGLYDAQHRDDHFQRAAERGTPVLADGFWALMQWLTATAMRANEPPPALRESVLPGIVWTAFSEPAVAARPGALRFVTSAGQTRFGDSQARDSLTQAARAVGRLEIESRLFASVSLLEPRIVICPWFVAAEIGSENADGSWTMRDRNTRVVFDPMDEGTARLVTRIVRTLRPAPGIELSGGSLDRDTLSKGWPVLLELAEDVPFAPLTRTSTVLEGGDAVAVIGFPQDDARLPPGTFAQHFAGSVGEKHVMPGVILRAPDGTGTLDYDCFTAAGTSGGPVIHLATGAIVAMHVAALPAAGGRKRGVGVVLDGLQ